MSYQKGVLSMVCSKQFSALMLAHMALKYLLETDSINSLEAIFKSQAFIVSSSLGMRDILKFLIS